MKSSPAKIIIVLLVFIFMCTITPPRVLASAEAIAAQINAIHGLFADVTGDTVTVTGTNENITTPLVLSINTGVTVNWEATYTGAVSPASSSMITIAGSGTFNVRNYGLISNAGTGNTLNVSGEGTAIRVSSEGTVQSSRSGSAIFISADNVEIDVGMQGYVISLDGNANAAIQIGSSSTTSGTVINVNGGSVISIGTGFAINDGAGTALINNNTKINVTAGVVTAGGNSAIHSTGIRSAVVASGGILSNSAGNNLNPVIDMVGDISGAAPPSYNITIGGTTVVQSSSANGYTLQSKGNILVQGNALVTAVNGRAINLVGLDSTALVAGGVIETTGNGTAISTATTNVETVTRASVQVTGGTVTSENGHAINITGIDSKVTVSGGLVKTASASNHAINASGAGATIEVSGSAVVSAENGDAIRSAAANGSAVSVSGSAKVSSVNGRAIQANGAGAGVTISGPSQVYVLNTGNAIRCTNGTVTLNSGFIFAYGTNASSVINSPHIVVPSIYAFVIAWNEVLSPKIYAQGTGPSLNPDLYDTLSAGYNNYFWYNHPTLGGGINYSWGTNTGFFQIPEVSIYGDYGLIFVSATGYMYQNVNNVITMTGNVPDSPNNVRFNLYNMFPPIRWSGASGVLNLHGFSWTTNTSTSTHGSVALDALTIVGDTNIIVTGESTFEAVHPNAVGIRFLYGNENISISGNSSLRTVGRNVSPGVGINIDNGGILLEGGTFIAQADQAISWTGLETGRITTNPSIFDYNWTFSQVFNGDGGTTGYFNTFPYDLNDEDKFVMFRPVTPVNLISAVQIGGISKTADSVAIELIFDKPVSGLTVEDITIANKTGEVETGVLNGTGTTWVLTLAGVNKEGLIDIEISEHFETFYVSSNKQENVEVYKAEITQFDIFLSNTVQDGGDFEKLFEFEIVFASDPREPQPVPLTTDPDNPDAYLVTYANPLSLPPGRIIGENDNVLLLKHGEAVKIYGLPVGFYYVIEHSNKGFVTAFDIDSEGWFTAPEGVSRIFRLSSDMLIDTFNSIVLEEQGDPERPFDPGDPERFIPPDSYNLLLSKTVQTGGDTDRLYEFEIFVLEISGSPPAAPVSADTTDTDTFFITFGDGTLLPPGRVTGANHSVFSLKHGETVMIRNLPIGSYIITEHTNEGFITSFNINSEGWSEAPGGVSGRIRHDKITLADCFNSINPEGSPQTGSYRDYSLSVIILIFGIISFAGAEIYRRKHITNSK